jgi:prophage maintenance system killer protein
MISTKKVIEIHSVLMKLILLENGTDIDANEDEKYQFVLSIANGVLRFDGICNWIIKNIKK